MKKLVVLVVAVPLVAPSLFAEQEDPAREQSRSMVMTQYGIVATSQAVASQAGAAILAKGGNAVDAAIAANAALGVIEPMMNGVGGDLFAIVYDAKTKRLYGLNASGWAPKDLSIEALKAKGLTRMRTVDAITVPGAVAGWDALHARWGRLSMAEELAPAVALATQGIAVTETDADNWKTYGMPFAGNPDFAHVFLPDGKAPVAGQLFKNPELAGTLRLIGEHGRDGFYEGPTADAILKLERQLGGFMQADDLTEFKPEWVDPVSTTYHGWTVYEMPPNGQGIAALQMLNIMEHFPIKEWGHNSQKSLHVEIEAKNLAYADLQHYIGDPHATHIPTQILISKELAAKRAKLITDRANCSVLPSDLTEELSHQASDTTYLSVVDRDGNEVSLIQSNAGAFGGGLVAPGTGFPLQNRGDGFTLKPGQAEYASPAHAAAAHDYSGVHGEGRPADRVRNYGRVQSGAGARAVCVEHCGFRYEYSGGSGGGSFYEANFFGLRCLGGERDFSGCGRGAAEPGAHCDGVATVLPEYGPGECG